MLCENYHQRTYGQTMETMSYHHCRRDYGNIFLQDDNTRLHRTRLIDRFLENEDVTRWPWPGMSPDIKPIEHVCDRMDRKLWRTMNSPTNLVELRLHWPSYGISSQLQTSIRSFMACTDELLLLFSLNVAPCVTSVSQHDFTSSLNVYSDYITI